MAAAGDEDALEDILRELPPDLREEVADFARFLRDRRGAGARGKIGFSWAGALRDLGESYTSKELAEESMDWWET